MDVLHVGLSICSWESNLVSSFLDKEWGQARGECKPGNEENWMFPAADRTEFEDRLIVAMATQIGVLTMMSTHRYSFAVKTYLQK